MIGSGRCWTVKPRPTPDDARHVSLPGSLSSPHGLDAVTMCAGMGNDTGGAACIVTTTRRVFRSPRSAAPASTGRGTSRSAVLVGA